MSRIYKRNNLIEGVVPKKNDEHARKRNVIINNRVTPEDRDIIYKRIELSGLKVQDYITECCKYSKVTAVGNVKLDSAANAPPLRKSRLNFYLIFIKDFGKRSARLYFMLLS